MTCLAPLAGNRLASSSDGFWTITPPRIKIWNTYVAVGETVILEVRCNPLSRFYVSRCFNSDGEGMPVT